MPFIYIIAYILVEITLFSIVGNAIGTLPMIILVVGGFFLGSFLIRTSGENVKASMQNAQSHLSSRNVSDTIARFFAGFLIILPGFFTDILGLLFMFRPARQFLAKLIGVRAVPVSPQSRAQDDVIEGTIIDDDTTLNK